MSPSSSQFLNYEIRVVLVRSIYERNVGSTSRAMSNMGATRLILVDPKCELTYEAQQAAATGQAGLQNRVVYPSWKSFYAAEPEGIRIAFTARDGRGRLVRDFAETLVQLKSQSLEEPSDETQVIYLIFGPEDWGLSASDLELVHFCCSIPTFGENQSLNLSQAVLLALFILRQNWGGERTRLDGQQPNRNADRLPAIFPEETLKRWVTEMGFDISKRRINAYSVLRRMILQNTPTAKEYMMLETVLQQSIRKLQEYNQLRKLHKPDNLSNL